jgi:hypothetical protein
MSRWFRHYSGMMRDEKLVAVAVKAKQPVERVLWVWGAILESAAEVNDNGRYDIDPSEIAYFLRADEADICLILDGLTNADRVASGFVVKWSNRQFQSDGSAARQAAYRERKRSTQSDGDAAQKTSDGGVTSRDGGVTSYTTDTDTEVPSLRSGTPRARRASPPGFEDFWLQYPNKVGKAAALKAFIKARSEADQSTIMAGLARYATKPDDRPWCNPATWLNQQRWLDAPASQAPPKRQNYTDATNEIIQEIREHERAKSQGTERDVQLFPGVSGRPEASVEYLPPPAVRSVGRGGS